MYAYYFYSLQLLLSNIIGWGLKNKTPSIEEVLKVVLSGLEPPTHGFSVRCSTN